MNAFSIEKLNDSFSLKGEDYGLIFRSGEGGIPMVDIHNQQASAAVSLQGSHVLSWVPVANDEMIWLSEKARFAHGKSIRGGIPICWPWFGAHVSNTGYPAHGFARTSLWQVADTQLLASGETKITFRLNTREFDDAIRVMWPLATVVEFCLTVGHTLTMSLTTYNYSDEAITIGQALHTYFSVNDIRRTVVYGLENREYLDKTDGFMRKTQDGPVIFDGEVDRVYLQTVDDIIIDDGGRKVRIKKQGSESTVLWNPWLELAERMGDLGEDGYLKMLCVESANAAEDIVRIAAGDNYTLSVSYAIE